MIKNDKDLLEPIRQIFQHEYIDIKNRVKRFDCGCANRRKKIATIIYAIKENVLHLPD